MADVEDKIHPQINYVDGTFAFIKDTISNISEQDNNGIVKLYHDFILIPTPRTIKRWDLKQKKEQGFEETGKYAGFYRKRYEARLCQQLDYSPKPVWLLHCDWNGKPIDIFHGLVELWKNLLASKDAIITTLTNQNKSLRSRLRSLSQNSLLDLERDAGRLRKIADKVGGATILNQGGQPEHGESTGQ